MRSYCFVDVFRADLSGVLSKDGETRNEVDLMLSTLGTSEPHAADEPTCSNGQTVGTVEQSSLIQTTHLPSALISTSQQQILVTESAFSSVSERSLMSCAKSFVSAGENCLVSESSGVSASNREPPMSGQADVDHYIVMTNALSTSTPLDPEESIVERVVPSLSACIVNIERQFAADNSSLTRGEFIMPPPTVGRRA